VTREEAYEQAAACYHRAGYHHDAARCYQLAGAHRRAAEIYESVGSYAESAAAFSQAGLPELGAWLLAHRAGLPDRARALLELSDDRETLRRPLILARCDIAERAPGDLIRPVIAHVCAALADRDVRPDPVLEEWAVALSESAARYDQAALVFACEWA
jgi:tetratricopeptide (TPR) repeat protein